jgi:hypothetical protein
VVTKELPPDVPEPLFIKTVIPVGLRIEVHERVQILVAQGLIGPVEAGQHLADGLVIRTDLGAGRDMRPAKIRHGRQRPEVTAMKPAQGSYEQRGDGREATAAHEADPSTRKARWHATQAFST